MIRNNSKSIIIAGVAICLYSTFLRASNLTPKDIIQGIEARKSKIRDVELLYSVVKDYQSGYFKNREDEMRSMAENPDSNQPKVTLRMPSQKEANTFHIFQKGNEIAYEIFSINEDKTRQLEQKAVFNGNIQKFLNVPKKNGVLEPISPDKFIKFATIKELAGIENTDLASFLQRSKIETTIVNEQVRDGDLIIEMSLKLPVYPDPENKYGHGNDAIITTWAVSVNASKDFWPIKIDRNSLIVQNGKEMGTLRGMEVTIGDFTESGGVYIPTKINATVFYHNDYTKKQEISYTQTVDVEKVLVNSNLSEEVFKMEFPNGTFYYDAIAGIGMTVGDTTPLLEEKIKKGIMEEALNSKPNTDSANSDQPHKNSKTPTNIRSESNENYSGQSRLNKVKTQSNWYLYAAVPIFSLCIGLLLAKIYSKKRKN
jgi:hypothetical protein